MILIDFLSGVNDFRMLLNDFLLVFDDFLMILIIISMFYDCHWNNIFICPYDYHWFYLMFINFF